MPIQLATSQVNRRGEKLDPIRWRAKQWAVTDYGIEALDGTYYVEAHRLLEQPAYPWPKHMAAKDWVDPDEFTTAWLVALVLHNQLNPAKLAASLNALNLNPPRERVPNAHRKMARPNRP